MSGTNPAASVRARLRMLAMAEGIDFGAILTRYGLERILYRLSISEDRDSFLLKGALLFDVWFDTSTRPTRDIDLLGFGPADDGRIADVFRHACAAIVDDGIAFDPTSVSTTDIRKTAGYPGIRVTMHGDLDGARIHVQVDIGFGDAITPGPEVITFPVLLQGMPQPVLSAYPKPTVIAEKLEAIVRLGRINSRVKDHFDLWWLLIIDECPASDVCPAVIATFERRGTGIPQGVPVGLSQEFASDPRVLAQWRAFIRRNRLSAPDMPELLGQIREAVMPMLDQVRQAHG